MDAYLAGPEVFLPDAVEIGAQKKAICQEFGITGHFPFDNQIDTSHPQASNLIFMANYEMIKRADIIICNLTPYPWMTPSADVGTAWELGCAFGMDKPCFGYTSDGRPFDHRFKVYLQETCMNDATNVAVESFNRNADNLMIDESLNEFERGSGDPFVDFHVIYRDMATFRRLLEKIAKIYRS